MYLIICTAGALIQVSVRKKLLLKNPRSRNYTILVNQYFPFLLRYTSFKGEVKILQVKVLPEMWLVELEPGQEAKI